LILSYVEDVPQSEIARRLELPLGTVKSRMRLAYRRLRQELERVK
jgi:RNA polymerase sigma-70 factor (ECF subfamily)